MRVFVVVFVVAISGGCASTLDDAVRRALEPPPHLTCPDGAAVRLFIGAACPHGVCGFTCAPNRWIDP